MLKRIKKSIISSLAVGSILFLAFILIRRGLKHPTQTLCSDGFIVVGMLLLLYTFFRLVSRTGFFDWIYYFIYTIKHALDRSGTGFMNYYDYISTLEHEDNPLWGIVVSGCFFIALGIVISVFR